MNKKILLSLIFVLLVSFLVIPNAYAGDNDPIVFTGTKFLTYLLQGNFGNYAWLDANKDGKLSQNELNELTGQIYINSNGWDSEDFENLKYLKNASQIILTEAHNTVEEVDLSGLTNLRYFSVEKADADYPPKFKLNNNLWQYLSPECEYVYNPELDISEKTYNYEHTENFKIYTLYLGGASTIHVDEVVHLADTQITIYNDAIIDVTRSNVAIVDHSVI